MKLDPNHSQTGRPAHQRGFTLVEMLLVLAILALLAAIVYPRIIKRQGDAQHGTAVVQIKALDSALEMFELDNGRVPKGRDGLQELLLQPSGTPNWKGPYVKEIPKDPWGNDYVYVYPGKHRGSSYDLSSAGPDGQMGTEDDINNWPAPQATR